MGVLPLAVRGLEKGLPVYSWFLLIGFVFGFGRLVFFARSMVFQDYFVSGTSYGLNKRRVKLEGVLEVFVYSLLIVLLRGLGGASFFKGQGVFLIYFLCSLFVVGMLLL